MTSDDQVASERMFSTESGWKKLQDFNILTKKVTINFSFSRLTCDNVNDRMRFELELQWFKQIRLVTKVRLTFAINLLGSMCQ